MKKDRLFWGLLAGVLTFALLVPATSWAQDEYLFKLDTEIPHCRVIFIGVLQGTWREMGIQYGQRAGEDVARNFDLCWYNRVVREDDGWAEGKTEAEKQEYVNKYIARSVQEFSYMSPEIIEFWEGIAEGAAEELAKGEYADKMPDLLKIATLNYSGLHFHPNWDFENDCPGSPPSAMKPSKTSRMFAKVDEHDCNGLWVKDKATKTGETFAIRAAQGTHIRPWGSGRERQISYVAIPSDPNARVFWGTSRAGNLGGGSGGGLMNDRGVCCLTAGAQYGDAYAIPDETLAPGIKGFWLATYGVIFGKSAREAANFCAVGNERYRELTERETVLRVRGANIVFADANEAFVVEQNARHYAIREPGYLGEKEDHYEGHYMVWANHFKFKDGSYDESNQFQKHDPMDRYCPEYKGDSSYYRFWAGMWILKNNFGEVDKKMMLREIAPLHTGYDKQGREYPPHDTGVPSVRGTFCSHSGIDWREGSVNPDQPLGRGGNTETTVFNLSTCEVWYVPVWPCHYREWNLSWSYCDLKPYSQYRQMLLGY